MTIETCKAGCAQFGYDFAGVQNKNVCNCGNTAPSSRRMPHENCDNRCGGDNTQFCGSSGFMDVFDIKDFDAGETSSSASYKGCFQDTSNPRGLSSYVWSSDSMTKEACRSSCKELGPYTLAGVQNGNQCYCGNAWAAGKILPDSSCSTPCKGNTTTTCGGSMTSAVYNTTTAPDIRKTKPEGWAGCYPSSAFSLGFYGSSGMTNANCQASCATQGFAYSGVRSGTNCYCAQTLPEASKRSPGVLCNQPCAGNSSETCGAAYLVDATKVNAAAVPASGYLGCFGDVNKVNNLTYTSTYMTRDTCNRYCMARSYPFAMTTLGNRCWCGYNNPTQKTTDSQCSTACTGDNKATCGGNNIGSVFKLTGSNTPTKFDMNTTASDGYAGCYAEGKTKLATLSYSLTSNTQTSCQSTCKGLGKAVSGTENGRECYCADSLDEMSGGYRVADSECNTACAGDASAKCGGYARLSVRMTAGAAGASSSNGAEGNIGCYETGSAIGKAGYDTTFSSMSTDYCRRTCRLKGFPAATLMNGNRCLCGTSADVGASLPSTLCNSACSGNSTQTCGGPSQVAVYDTNGPGAMPPTMPVAGYSGCFINDNPSAFTYQTTSSANSLSWCSRLCSSMSYSTFGVSGIYCGCGNTVPTLLQTDAMCATKCPASTDMCGGSNRWSVFTSNKVSVTTPAVSSSTSSQASSSAARISTSSSIAVASSTRASTSAAAVSPSSASVTLRSSSVAASSATVSRTSSVAAASTVPVTSRSSSVPVGAPSSTVSRTSSVAATPTAATTLRASSAATRASSIPGGVALVTDSTTAAAPAQTTAPANTDPSNKGCFAANRNVMSSFEMKCSTLDPTMCKLLCRYKGFPYAAVTNGDTCLCGGNMNGLTSSTSCSAPCTGDSKLTCGGADAMQVFSTEDVSMPAMAASQDSGNASSAGDGSGAGMSIGRKRRTNLIRKIRRTGSGISGHAAH